MSTIVSIDISELTTKVDMYKKPYQRRAAEFFAGIGLVRLALERQGWSTVFANDISPDKLDIYRQNFDESVFVLDDIWRLSPADIPDVELATACFPCTDISLAGEREGLRGQESNAFWGFIRILRAKPEKPAIVIIENVEGLLSSNGGKDFRAVIRALNGLGYTCDAFMVDSREFVPQSRRRVLIVGAIPCLADARSSASTLPDASWARPASLLRAVGRNEDLKWFFMKVPSAPPLRRAQVKNVLEKIPTSSSRWWSADRVKKLVNQMAGDHRKVLDWAKSCKEEQNLCVYRRTRDNQPRAEVRADGLAGCLRTATGGSSRQILVIAGDGQVRVRFMTPREYARLQGVPDTFKLDVSEGKALIGLGDAVCVPVIEWLVEHCVEPLIGRNTSRKSSRAENGPTAKSLIALSASA
jgi:DNA (cytosine-5)-methyltransferase 1